MSTVTAALSTIVLTQNIFAYGMKPVEPPQKQRGHSHGNSSQKGNSLSGQIVETMNSGGYTYLQVEEGGKKTWAAIPETEVSVGQDVSLQPGFEMNNFTSKTLNRTFEKIIFSNGLVNSQRAAEGGGSHYTTKGSKGVRTSPNEDINIKKAQGQHAYTVAELFKNRAQLHKESISVRGKVVKVSPAIMGKNWLHIQDGTGSPDKGNYDLVVTTQGSASVGDVVTVDGILYKDKDFGSGYKYDVIIEKAKIKK